MRRGGCGVGVYNVCGCEVRGLYEKRWCGVGVYNVCGCEV